MIFTFSRPPYICRLRSFAIVMEQLRECWYLYHSLYSGWLCCKNNKTSKDEYNKTFWLKQFKFSLRLSTVIITVFCMTSYFSSLSFCCSSSKCQFLVKRIVKVRPAHVLGSVCGFSFEPVASIDLHSDGLLAWCFKEARCGLRVLIQSKQAACEWNPITTGCCIYKLTDTHVHLDVNKMWGHAYERTCGCRKASRETDLKLSRNSILRVHDLTDSFFTNTHTNNVMLQIDEDQWNTKTKTGRQVHHANVCVCVYTVDLWGEKLSY